MRGQGARAPPSGDQRRANALRRRARRLPAAPAGRRWSNLSALSARWAGSEQHRRRAGRKDRERRNEKIADDREPQRSEEHTSELQSLMRISYAVFCLKKKKIQHNTHKHNYEV